MPKTNVGSTYGAAGSLVVLLVWVYYSSFILYFGAEFTKVFAIKYGSQIHPYEYAVFTKVVEVEEGKASAQQIEKKSDEQILKNGLKNEKNKDEYNLHTGLAGLFLGVLAPFDAHLRRLAI